MMGGGSGVVSGPGAGVVVGSGPSGVAHEASAKATAQSLCVSFTTSSYADSPSRGHLLVSSADGPQV